METVAAVGQGVGTNRNVIRGPAKTVAWLDGIVIHGSPSKKMTPGSTRGSSSATDDAAARSSALLKGAGGWVGRTSDMLVDSITPTLRVTHGRE
jgi:hypothetical protein